MNGVVFLIYSQYVYHWFIGRLLILYVKFESLLISAESFLVDSFESQV